MAVFGRVRFRVVQVRPIRHRRLPAPLTRSRRPEGSFQRGSAQHPSRRGRLEAFEPFDLVRTPRLRYPPAVEHEHQPTGPGVDSTATAGRVWTRRLALAAALTLVAALAAERLWLIPVHVSFNPNEGWNAFQAARAVGVGPLYPTPIALTGDNYPPLSFLLVGGIARATGADLIVAGRWVSLSAVLTTGASVAWVVRRLDPGRSWAPIVAALVFLGFNVTEFRAYLAMDDPQWLAHALMTPALALLLPERPHGAPRTGRTAAAAALVVTALLVKHNLLALPIAATLWLLRRHRGAFVAWASAGAAAATVACASILAVYGIDALHDVLQSPRAGSWLRMVRASSGPVLAGAPLLVPAAALLRLRRSDPRLELPLLFIALALPLGVLQRSGQGVNFNAHFEGLIALSVSGGAALAHALAAKDGRGSRWRLGWLVLSFLALAPLAVKAAWSEAEAVPVERAAWTAMEARIAGAGGPVACETPALCFWAGQPFVLDFFLYGQRIAKSGDASALMRSIDKGAVVAVQRDPDRRMKAGDARNPVSRLLDRRSSVTFKGADGRWLELLHR